MKFRLPVQMRLLKTVGLLLALMLSLPLFMAGKCSEGEVTSIDDPEEFSVVVDLRNTDPEPIHIFAPGEDFGCCRLSGATTTLGTIRNKQMTLQTGTLYTFRAGRDAVILDTQTCRVRSDGAASHNYEVLWHSVGTAIGLSCLGNGWTNN